MNLHAILPFRLGYVEARYGSLRCPRIGRCGRWLLYYKLGFLAGRQSQSS